MIQVHRWLGGSLEGAVRESSRCATREGDAHSFLDSGGTQAGLCTPDRVPHSCFPSQLLVLSRMPARYAPVPNPTVDPDAEREMEAAFDDSDDSDDDQDLSIQETRPLRHPLQRSRSPSPDRGHGSSTGAGTSALPGAYDFENTAYDLPPPGSPPPATQAFVNDWGNSNGVIPESPNVDTYRTPKRGWFGRAAAAILPAHYVSRLGLGTARPTGPVGGGNQNDGVFANVTAKPVRGVRVQDGKSSNRTQLDSELMYLSRGRDICRTRGYPEGPSPNLPRGSGRCCPHLLGCHHCPCPRRLYHPRRGYCRRSSYWLTLFLPLGMYI
jgi:hypothetical protein